VRARVEDLEGRDLVAVLADEGLERLDVSRARSVASFE
jgi:hypothetical protein